MAKNSPYSINGQAGIAGGKRIVCEELATHAFALDADFVAEGFELVS